MNYGMAESTAKGLDPTLAEGNAWNWLWWHNHVDASNFASGSDAVFFYIFWVSAFFFVVLMVLMAYFVIAYRRVPGKAPERSASHNTPLELAWSIIPSILMAVMFIWGLYEYIPMRVPPADSEVIQVHASQWNWSWTYDNGAQTQMLETIADQPSPVFALPVDRPVKFVMSSADVIHSMWIAAFRIKRDVFPNMYTNQWVTAKQITHRYDETTKEFVPLQPGVNDGFYLTCAEYCGDQHSQMWARVMVMAEADYQRWKSAMASTDSIPALELGQKLHKIKGCNACHSVDGSPGTGPTWKGIWGETHTFSNGAAPAVVDANYIRESVLEPAVRVRTGFPNQMVSYQGRLTDREIYALALYIESLSSNPADVEAAKAASEREAREREAAKNEAEAAKSETDAGK